MIIKRIWRQQEGKYFCLSTKDASGTFKDTFFKRSEFRDIEAFLERNRHKNIYFCPHGFSRPRRRKQFAVPPNLLWSDMDGADPRTCKYRPTIAIESSPGRFVGLWITDKPCDDALNRRMAHAIDGDPSGWDFTQVLRVPGTLNYKYSSMPKVRLMWFDGPVYKVNDLLSKLPQEKSKVTDSTDAAEVFKKYEKVMEPWLKRELMTRRAPKEGNRSEMMFKLACGLVEAGLSEGEGSLLLKSTVWNKYRMRRDHDRQIALLWERAINKKMSAGAIDDNEEGEKPKYQFLARSLADIEEKDLDWVWYPYLARGEVTILQGDPEAGKSFISQNVCGAICTGKALPCHIDGVPVVKGTVAYFDIENSPETVTKKRLRWASFDLEAQKNFYQEEQPFSVNDEEAMAAVDEGLENIRPALIVFDTLATYIGKTDTNSNAESQQSFLRFRQMARKHNCAVLVLRHLTKGARDRAMYRGQGNIAFTGVARIEITAGQHPEDPDIRVMARSKGNLTAKPPALTYQIIDVSNKKERDRARFEWGDFDNRLTAESIVTIASDDDKSKKGAKERVAARELIEQMLGEGRNKERLIVAEAESRSINKRVLMRVKDEMKLITRGKGEKTSWHLE